MDDMIYLWDMMVEMGIATNEELALVCKINGESVESLLDVLFVRTGLHNLMQLIDALNEE